MNLQVDADTCTGCALCEETCPEVFKLNEESVAEVINANPGPDLEDKVKEAAEGCPVDAISL